MARVAAVSVLYPRGRGRGHGGPLIVGKLGALAATRRRGNTFAAIERVVHAACSFREAEEIDRSDIAAMSFEERISAVEHLRRQRSGEDRAESRLGASFCVRRSPAG
jgi:hypothetical protein